MAASPESIPERGVCDFGLTPELGRNQTETPQAEDSGNSPSRGYLIASQPGRNQTLTSTPLSEQQPMATTPRFNGTPVAEDSSVRERGVSDQYETPSPFWFSTPPNSASFDKKTRAASLRSFIEAKEDGVLTIDSINESGEQFYKATISVDQIFSSSENIDLWEGETEEDKALKNKIALFIKILREHKPNNSWQSDLNNPSNLDYIQQISQKMSTDIQEIKEIMEAVFSSINTISEGLKENNSKIQINERYINEFKDKIITRLQEVADKLASLSELMSSKKIYPQTLSRAILGLCYVFINIKALVKGIDQLQQVIPERLASEKINLDDLSKATSDLYKTVSRYHIYPNDMSNSSDSSRAASRSPLPREQPWLALIMTIAVITLGVVIGIEKLAKDG